MFDSYRHKLHTFKSFKVKYSSKELASFLFDHGTTCIRYLFNMHKYKALLNARFSTVHFGVAEP